MNFHRKFHLFLVPLFLIFLIFTNCQPDIEHPPATLSEPVTYLALGDSYTIGTGIEEENNWPNQLADSLIANGLPVDTTQIIATNGWTTTDLKNGINREKLSVTFDVVSLLIGVNNQYQGLDVDLYRTEFRELLEKSIEFAANDTGNVFVVSIPNYGVTPFAESRNPDIIRREIETYNEIAKQISAEYNIPFINITSISELAADDVSLLASDELHPSAKMYSIWIEEMLPTVTKIIRE